MRHNAAQLWTENEVTSPMVNLHYYVILDMEPALQKGPPPPVEIRFSRGPI